MSENNLQNLRKEMEKKTTGVFWLGIHIAFIFAVPAALGAFLGVYLDNLYKTGKSITIAILTITFISSWVVTTFKYRKASKELMALEEKINRVKRDELNGSA